MDRAGEFGALPEGFADFPRVWREEAAPKLAALEAERTRGARIFRIGIGAGVTLAIVLVASIGGSGNLEFALFAATAAIALSAAGSYLPLAAVSKKAKHALMGPAMTALGFRHTLSGFAPPAFATLLGYRLLPGHSRARFEDLIEGADFALCEAHLETEVRSKNGSHYVTVFRGLIGRIAHPARVTGETVLARDMGWFNAVSAPRGMKRAGLVDSRFEKTFELWTTDQVEARYLVTPAVMERLLALETEFHGRKLRAAFAEGALFFALESRNLFEVGSPFRSYADPARMQTLIAELASVCALVAALRTLPAGS